MVNSRENATAKYFELCNPVPRSEEEQALHGTLAAQWAGMGLGPVYGIQLLTGADEARFRDPDFTGDPSTMDPAWGKPGVVTARMTVSAEGVPRGKQYQELVDKLASVVPGISVNLVPWDMEPPVGHTLAQFEG